LQANLLSEGGPDLAVVLVPWTVDAPHPEKVIAEEEPAKQAAAEATAAEQEAG
jgi:hypothetical protein